MGRSRAVAHSDEDPYHGRSKRKKTTSGLESFLAASAGQGIREGNWGLYHCNYCNKDISGIIRIKCVMCMDFDLCVECFSVGAELTPHKSNHPYRVMDNLSFPLLCPDWNADEEMLLLEGIGTYGFGNWTEVAGSVGTKSKLQCIEHYNAVYMNSPCFPFPDMSQVMGKSKEELLAMAKGPGDEKGQSPKSGELMLKEDSSVSATAKCEELKKEDLTHQSSSSLTSGSTTDNVFSGSVKKASNITQVKDSIKVEGCQTDRSIGEKKPRSLSDEVPSMTELSGYNVRRQEFEIEYDNDAEHLLADMEFKDSDSDAERQLKLQVLRIYLKRLDERKRRKDFILERNLLYPDPFEKSLSPEEKAICQRLKVFMRFHSKEEHEELIRCLIEDHRILRRIQDLQEARAAGCRTSSDANRFIEQKWKEAQETAGTTKESSQPGPISRALERSTPPVGDWDISGFPGADLLSDTERRLCSELRILPAHYLSMLQTMSTEIQKGNVTKKSDVHRLFMVEPSKVDRVYEMLVNKGIAPA